MRGEGLQGQATSDGVLKNAPDFTARDACMIFLERYNKLMYPQQR